MKRWWVLLVLLVAGCGHPTTPRAPVVVRAVLPMTKFQQVVVAGLRDQLTWGTGYDGSYVPISYPGGDVPRQKGACTDVVIRAYRRAGVDLQKLIHQDMVNAWDKYPHSFHLPAPDANIDHRRVPNQRVYFERHWKTLTNSKAQPKEWQPGDVVEWRMPVHGTHTAVLTETLDAAGLPCVIENLGNGPEEDDGLQTDWTIIGHFRYVPPKLAKPP